MSVGQKRTSASQKSKTQNNQYSSHAIKCYYVDKTLMLYTRLPGNQISTKKDWEDDGMIHICKFDCVLSTKSLAPFEMKMKNMLKHSFGLNKKKKKKEVFIHKN